MSSEVAHALNCIKDELTRIADVLERLVQIEYLKLHPELEQQDGDTECMHPVESRQALMGSGWICTACGYEYKKE